MPMHNYSDQEWATLAASCVVTELLDGKVIKLEQADFARRIVSQELYVLLVSNVRPGPSPYSN